MDVVLRFLNSFLRIFLFTNILKTVSVYGNNASLRTFADYFGTEKFLFVGISNCHLTVERNPPARSCPYHITYQSRVYENSEQCVKAKMHLWLSEGSRPFALVLFPSPHGYLESKLNELFWPDRSSQGFAFSSRKLDFYNSTSITNFIRYDDIIFSLFDNDYRLLYITLRSCAMRGNMSMCCLIFTGSLNDNGTVNFGYVGMSRVHANNNKRHWSEDPYEKKFYYTFESQGIIRLYSVPFSKILLVMADGTSGKLEMSFKVGIEYFSVSRNVVISHRNDAGKILHFIQDLNSTKSKGIICEEETSASSLHDRFLLTVIFDKDYCVLDDGLNSSFNCSSVETVTTLMMPEMCKVYDVIYWLVAIIAILICFIIILGVQLWRSRRETADKTFLKAESPRIHYYPTFVKDGSPDF